MPEITRNTISMNKFNRVKEVLEAFKKHAIIHGETQINGKILFQKAHSIYIQ